MSLKASIQDLPLELVNYVFKYLAANPQDVCAARLTCSCWAAIGIDHLMHVVPLVFKRDRLERLSEIAKHPRIPRTVQSLFYQADQYYPRLPVESCSACDTSGYCWPGTRLSDYADEREFLVYSPDQIKDHKFCKDDLVRILRTDPGMPHMLDWDEGVKQTFHAYVCAAADEMDLIVSDTDVRYLNHLFRACPNLDDVTIKVGRSEYQQKYPRMLDLAFEGIVQPPSHINIFPRGVQPLEALARVTEKSGRHLKRLALVGLTQELLVENPLALEKMQNLVSSLHELDIRFELLEDELSKPFDMYRCLGYGQLRDLLAAATELRVLKVDFKVMDADPHPDLIAIAELSQIVDTSTWSHLRELHLGSFAAGEEQFYTLVKRHHPTLERLSLANIDLSSGSWSSLFTRLAKLTPPLQHTQLRGSFMTAEDEYKPTEFDFDCADGDIRPTNFLRDAVETYLVHGGDFPDRDALLARDVKAASAFLLSGEYISNHVANEILEWWSEHDKSEDYEFAARHWKSVVGYTDPKV